MKVTDEHAHDSKLLPELVGGIIDSDSLTTIGQLFADGAYDSNGVLDVLKTMKSYLVLN